MTDLSLVSLRRCSASTKPLAVLCAAFCITAGVATAQQASSSTTTSSVNDAPGPSTSLASQFFDHDYFNVFAFGNGTYDSAVPQVGTGGYAGAWGYTVGGGLTVGRRFKDGDFSLSYKGDYRHFFSSTYSSGSDQSASMLYTKRLSRHWSMSSQASGGNVVYGGSFYSTAPSVGANVLTNPLSSQSRFANAGVSLTYEQTRRLSYTFGGQFFLSSYNYPGAVSSVGGSGSVAVNYRTTARTTLGASYSRTYFQYGKSSGATNIDGGYLTLSHVFPDHWTASVSAGISHTHSHGVITQAVSVLLGGLVFTGYETGPYDRTYNAPSFQGTLTRTMRRSLFSIGGGQGVNAGNGTFLASKDQFANATYSYTRRLTNFSFGGGYTRLTSIANTVSTRYSTATMSASYGFNVVRYVSANLRYDFIHYDNFYSLNGLNESRFSFGFSFSSKSIPLTLF